MGCVLVILKYLERSIKLFSPMCKNWSLDVDYIFDGYLMYLSRRKCRDWHYDGFGSVLCLVWAGSSAGIATDYGLDGPGSKVLGPN